MGQFFGVIGVLLLICGYGLPAMAKGSPAMGLDTPPRSYAENIRAAGELGVTSLRVDLNWQMVEPQPGRFNWTITDRMVKEARAKHLEILFVLKPISAWGTTRKSRASGIYNSASAPRDMAQWTSLVSALAVRYRDQGVSYEIGNEVNGQAFWDGTQQEYLALLRASYGAIKGADPRARVLSAAMGCGVSRNFTGAEAGEALRRHDGWLRPILATGAFDVVAVHDYYYPGEAAENGFSFQSYLDHVRQLMKEAGVDDRPIWITEMGFAGSSGYAGGHQPAGSPDKQAQGLAEAYRQAADSGVERMFWLLLRDREEAFFGSMGLMDAQGRPRPAWQTLQQLTGVRP